MDYFWLPIIINFVMMALCLCIFWYFGIKCAKAWKERNIKTVRLLLAERDDIDAMLPDAREEVMARLMLRRYEIERALVGYPTTLANINKDKKI